MSPISIIVRFSRSPTSSDSTKKSDTQISRTIEQDKKNPVGRTELELVNFLKPGEKMIDGGKLLVRSKELSSDLGQYHAGHLLRQSRRLPKSWRAYYILFPGTIFINQFGVRQILYLAWGGEKWHLGYTSIESYWGSSSRLLRARC